MRWKGGGGAAGAALRAPSRSRLRAASSAPKMFVSPFATSASAAAKARSRPAVSMAVSGRHTRTNLVKETTARRSPSPSDAATTLIEWRAMYHAAAVLEDR